MREKRIDKLRRIIKEGQYARINGVIVDVSTAKIMCIVWDNMDEKKRELFQKMDIRKLSDFCWSLTK